MQQWLKFEEQCVDYLNKKFGEYAEFSHLGGEDSTVPDICVKTKTGKEFYMDVKLASAQCGQFVLLPEVANKCFVFSDKNKTALTEHVQKIISHMNADFDAYKEAGTSGREIDLHDGGEVFCQWIVENYRGKRAEFFITEEYTILLTEDILKHFDVSATYRVKRSGSSKVGGRSMSGVVQHLKDQKYQIERFWTEDGKLFVYSATALHDRRFTYNGFEYMFSQRADHYEVRKLSNTFNANVIFSISKKKQKGLTDVEFIKYLR